MTRIKRIHDASKGTYGAPRVRAELVSEGLHVGRHKIAKLMRLARLRGCPKRRYRSTTVQNPRHRCAKNLLRQNFFANRPNRVWVADITYIPTSQGWLYLAVVIDLYSRRVVGWSMSRWISRRLAISALQMAIEARQPDGALIHHSDRGAQYTSDDFRDVLAQHNIQCSMSRTGNCYDNAVVESFFGVLKRECVNRKKYHTREEARADIFEYIEVFYNRRRRHSYLGDVCPVEYETRQAGSFKTVHS